MFETPDEPLLDVVDFDLTRHLDTPPDLDENLLLGATRTWRLSRQRLFELLRDAPAIDLAQSRDERDRQWQYYWKSRAPHTASSRQAEAALQFRLHFQAASERAFAEGRMSAEQRLAVQRLVNADGQHQARIVHGRLASGSQQSLPGALVIADRLLYLPNRPPAFQAFEHREALEQFLLQREDLLGTCVGIDYEMPADPLDSACKRLLGAVATRRLEATTAEAALAFDTWRSGTPLLVEAPAIAIADSDDTPAQSFGSLYRDLPFATRVDKVRQQLAALEALADEHAGTLPPSLHTLLDSLSSAQGESFAAASALLAPAVPDRTSEAYQALGQARIAGLRYEADIQQALGLLDTPRRALLDAVLLAPQAGSRLDPVIAAALYLHHPEQPGSHELDGVLLFGHSDDQGHLASSLPVLLYWPGVGGGLQDFASVQALERVFFKLAGDRQLQIQPLAEDAFDYSLARQLSKYEARLRDLQSQAPDADVQALREETLDVLQVPVHAARDKAREFLLEQQRSLILAHQAPDWLQRLEGGERQRLKQLIGDYLAAVQRSRNWLATALPLRGEFARQQVAGRLRQAFGLSRDLQVQLDLPDSVSYGRDPVPGSGAPGTPVKLILIPSATRSRLSLEDLALQQVDPAMRQRLQFMQVLVDGGEASERSRVLAGIDVQWLATLVDDLDLAGGYERRIIEAFMGTAQETAFTAAYREESLLDPLRLMLRIHGEAALRQQRIDARGMAILAVAIDAALPGDGRQVSLLPLLLTSGGEDTDGHGAGLSGITLIHASDSGTTLLYLPDSPDGQFLRQFDSLESARKAVFRLCFSTSMAEYLAGRALSGNIEAHRRRLDEACVRQFDGIIGLGLAWPADTSLARHLCDAHKGRLIVAHRATSRSRHDLFMERYALESGMVFNYIKMALGVIPFVGTLVAAFDGWLAANRAAAAFQRGDVKDALEQLESVLMCLIDAMMDLMPGFSVNPTTLRQATRQRQLGALASLHPARSGGRTALQRFAGYEHAGALSLDGLAPGTDGRYRNIYRHTQGDFILSHGRTYQVIFDDSRHTWRLLGDRTKRYCQPITLDENGQWDTHGAVFGVNIISPVSGGGGVLGHLADGLDPLWPAVIRERLPRWWTDPALRRLRALRSSTDYQLRELHRLNQLTGDEQRIFNRLTDDQQRLRQAEKLASHFAYERQLADKIYPELEELAQLSAGNNRTRARDLMSRVAWLQTNRLLNELNGVKRSATEILEQVDVLVEQTASTPATELARHLAIMKRRKVLRIQLIGKLQAVANYTHAIEMWSRRITNATQKSKVSEDIAYARRNFNQSTCDILKVRNYLEVINRYETATDESWFYLQIPVAKARAEVDRNLNNLFHLPEVRSNAEQRKRMLEACVDSFERYRYNLRAWATSYGHCFDHDFVDPLLEHLQSISELAERWKQKIPDSAPKPAPGSERGPSVARKLFETEDHQFFIGIEDASGGSQRRMTISRVNNRTEVYVPGKAGRWRLLTEPGASRPGTPVAVERLLREARDRLDKLPAYRDKVHGYTRSDMLPRDLEHLLLSEASELRMRAERIAEQNPHAELIATLRRKADELASEGRDLRIRQSLASKTPNDGMLDYLIEQKAVDIRKIGSPIKLPKHIEGRADYLLEYEIRDLTQGQPYTLWFAHFHYPAQVPAFERFTKAHLKTPEQRRLGLQWQLAQGDGAERIWRGDISRPIAKKHFAASFSLPASQ